jgi:hypothetical protein
MITLLRLPHCCSARLSISWSLVYIQYKRFPNIFPRDFSHIITISPALRLITKFPVAFCIIVTLLKNGYLKDFSPRAFSHKDISPHRICINDISSGEQFAPGDVLVEMWVLTITHTNVGLMQQKKQTHC